MDSEPGIFVGGPQDGAIYPIPIVPPFHRPPDFFLLPLRSGDPDKMVEYMMGTRAVGQEDRLYRYGFRESRLQTIEALVYTGVVHVYEYGRMKARIERGPAASLGGA